jgi:hypothetical protein
MKRFISLVLCCCALASCALFSPADYAHCLPQPAALVSDVATILKGDDYQKGLADLALAKTEAAVICAVQQFIDNLNGKVAAGSADAVAVSRGEAWLKEKGAK